MSSIGRLGSLVALPIIETVVSVITTLMTVGGLAALVLLMTIESFGIPPLPSEIILPFGGFLIATGVYSWPGAIGAALLGGVIGSYIAYAVGRWGRKWLERPTGRLRLDPRHLAMMDRWFARHGEGTVLIARLLPVVRSYISYPAGTARMEPVRFGVYTLVGATPFTVALIYAGYILGSNWSILESGFRVADYFAAAAIVGIGVYIALRWRNVITSGFPPRLARRAAEPAPDGDTPPTAPEVAPPPR